MRQTDLHRPGTWEELSPAFAARSSATRVLNCGNCKNKRCHEQWAARVADTSLSGARVGRELDAVIARRGRPMMIVSGNGTELTSMAILRWSQLTRIEWHYIAPGKP